MDFRLTFTLGNVVTVATVLASLGVIYRLVLRPFRLYFQEHNLMWEDYSIRHGLPYRVREGRMNGKPAEHKR